MEAPDKISYDFNGEQVYIRKDAIMEWAKEGKEHYKKLMEDFPDEISFAASFGAYNAFIEKLNSLESPAGMYKTE